MFLIRGSKSMVLPCKIRCLRQVFIEFYKLQVLGVILIRLQLQVYPDYNRRAVLYKLFSIQLFHQKINQIFSTTIRF
jgi:hypothetical protein